MSVVLKRASQLPFEPVVALLFAGVAAILVVATPGWMLEQAVVGSGLPSILGAAEPPLGLKAKIFLAVLAAAAVGISGLLSMRPIGKMLSRPRRGAYEVKPMQFRPPVTEQENDWPISGMARKPIFAGRDLGAPFMSDEALMEAPVEQAWAQIEAQTESQPLVAPEPVFVPQPALKDEDELMLDVPLETDESVLWTSAPMSDDPVIAVPTVSVPFIHEQAADLPAMQPSSWEPIQRASPAPTPAPTSAPSVPLQTAVESNGAAGDSIASLVMRLERGIEQRSTPPATDPFSADAALSEALGALDRIAAGSR